MAKCWCGKTHPRGDVRNSLVKHFVMNWKLYQLRHKDGKEEEEERAGEKTAIPALSVRKSIFEFIDTRKGAQI